MTEVERILDQYDRVMDGNAWHGDPIWKVLDGIPAEQASARMHANTHTIWELLLHMALWETVVRYRLTPLPSRQLEELNFPVMPEPTGENWDCALKDFRRSNADFRRAVSLLDALHVDQTTPGGDKSIYVEVHGVIQHHLYHAGQIAILRRFWEQK